MFIIIVVVINIIIMSKLAAKARPGRCCLFISFFFPNPGLNKPFSAPISHLPKLSSQPRRWNENLREEKVGGEGLEGAKSLSRRGNKPICSCN